MSLSASTVWEVRTTGSDSNGGAFVTGASGTDRSQQDAAQATLTTASVIHTTTTQVNVAVGDFTVSAADVGNILQITGGTATAGFYQITVVDVPNNRWTLDRSAGTAAQTVAGAMGGAMLSVGKIATSTVAGNIVYIKNGTYTISTASTNVSTGCVLSTTAVVWVGYSATRTVSNTGTKPILQIGAGVSSATILAGSSASPMWINVEFDGNSQTSAKWTTASLFVRCTARNFNVFGPTNTVAIGCYFTGNSASLGTGACYGCEATANTATPFTGTAVNCISYANTGASTDGFDRSASAIMSGCVSYGNGRSGFRQSTGSGVWVNCIAVNNATYGFDATANTRVGVMQNCAAFNNTSGSQNLCTEVGTVSISGDPFTNAASSDFSLNSTAGRGAALKAVDFPAIYPAGLTSSYGDIGVAQHQDAGGGTGGVVMSRVRSGY